VLITETRTYPNSALIAGALIVIIIFWACQGTAWAGAGAEPMVRLSGHVPSDERNSACMGTLPGDQKIDFAITLPMRNRAQAQSLIHRMYDPSDSLHGKYLSTAQISSLFGPTAGDYAAVIAFAESHGLNVTHTHNDRMLLDVEADSATVDSALNLHLNRYRQASGKVYYAPDTDPSVPASIAARITGFVGLDNFAQPTTNLNIAPAYGPFDNTGISSANGTGVGGGLAPSDIKTAYGFDGSVTETGAGQTLGLFELDGYTPSDITSYQSAYGLGNATVTPIQVDGTTNTPGGAADEVTLDIEMQLAMAPSIDQIRVYEGPPTWQGSLDTWTAIYDAAATVKVISTSWGYYEEGNPPSAFQFEGDTFTDMALAGQTVYAATGDHGAYPDQVDYPSTLFVQDPSTQPYVTAVGGTLLSTTSPGGAYSSETTWNDGTGAGGGGVSAVWTIPSYQSSTLTSPAPAPSGKTYSLTQRNVPDVSLNSSGDNAYDIYFSGDDGVGWYLVAGTSAASPLWAGFTALVNQRRAANGQSAIGFINPDIYTIGVSSAYDTNFHDVSDGSTNNYYTAVTGYDDATGWGSFRAAAMMTTLAFTSAPAAPGAFMATAGNGQVTLNWTAATHATSYTVTRCLTSGGAYAAIYTGSATTYNDAAAVNGTTYYYYVTASDLWGASGNSSQASATPAAGSAPGVPSGVSATGGNAQVTLNWTVVSLATSYNVERSTTSGSGYATVGSPLSATYVDGAAANGTTYYYVVTAVNGAGTSSASSQVSATPALPAPGIPGSVTATAGNAQVTLNWTVVSLAASYNVERSTTSGSGYATVGSPTSPTYVDGSLTNGTAYYYVVTAVNASGTSSASSQASATPQISAPSAPSTLTAVAGNAEVTLTWSTVAGSTAYNVKRAGGSGGPYSTIVSATASTSAVDSGVSNGTTYYYVVSALNAGGESANSSQVSATPYIPAPGAPAGLSAVPGNGQIALSWSAVGGATSYNVKQLAGNGLWVTIATVGSASYTNTGLTNGTAYTYCVSAINTGGESANSGSVTSTPEPSTPGAPTGLTGVPQTGYAALTWTAVSGATSYSVLRGTVSGGPYGTTVASGLIPPQLNDSTVASGITYYYVVTASNAAGTSGNSTQASVVMPAVTSHTVAYATSTAQSSLVNYGTSSSSLNFSQSGAALVTLHNVTLSGLSVHTTYYYQYQYVLSGVTKLSAIASFST
jgi:subtilase family serine protease